MKILRDSSMRRYILLVNDLDLRNVEEGIMSYYDLPEEKRWLKDNSPYEIGGRATDVSQIAYSLSGIVRDLYPINKVPKTIELQLVQLEKVCKECEREINDTINLISQYQNEPR